MQEKHKAGVKRSTAISILLWVAALIIVIIANADAGRDPGTTDQAEQTEGNQELSVREHIDDVELYGCNLIGVYSYPFNTMSQDWSGEDLIGFRYHEISDSAQASGGYMPPIMQIYTYIVCKRYGVDYEMVFALIEQESKCIYDAEGDNGNSIGYMQIQAKSHEDRMQRLGVADLKNPFQNVLVGVDILAELQEDIIQSGTDPEMVAADTLAAYQYGMQGAQVHLWANGVHLYSYNQAILDRAEELRQEAAEGSDYFQGEQGQAYPQIERQ